MPFLDADDFHSRSNKEKMKSGKPLTDEDRFLWLTSINAAAIHAMKKTGAVIACSALKEKYRTVLSNNIIVPIYWAFLQGNYDLILKRMKERKDHFMPPSLLASQFETLEIPKNGITIDISDKPNKIVAAILKSLKE